MIATFHKNDALLGNYKANYQLLQRHDIIQSYLTGPIGIRIPSLPAAELSDIQGYNFLDRDHQEMSYYVFLDALGLFRSEGSPISQNTWLESQFMLPFKTTFETDRFSSTAGDRVLQHPITNSSPTSLYVRFAKPTTYVVRVTCFYKCLRRLQINSSREAFLSHVIDQ